MALDPTATTPPPGFIRLGRLGRTFQLDGALRLQLDDAVSYAPEGDGDDADALGVKAIGAAGQLFVTGLGNARVRELKYGGGALLIRFAGVTDRNAARRLVNAVLYVDPSSLPSALAEEVAREVEAGSSEERLIGLPVLLDGRRVGAVTGANLNSANPFVEAELVEPRRRVLLPLSAPYIELSEGGIEISDPPAGLLGEE